MIKLETSQNIYSEDMKAKGQSGKDRHRWKDNIKYI
jgi:hypothetical protein